MADALRMTDFVRPTSAVRALSRRSADTSGAGEDRDGGADRRQADRVLPAAGRADGDHALARERARPPAGRENIDMNPHDVLSAVRRRAIAMARGENELGPDRCVAARRAAL